MFITFKFIGQRVKSTKTRIKTREPTPLQDGFAGCQRVKSTKTRIKTPTPIDIVYGLDWSESKVH